MTTHTIPTKHCITVTLLLVGALAVQPAAAALAKPPLQLAQLTTAVLTLPVSALTVANPDAKGLALLDAALRATNEILAACRQKSFYSAGWACVDVMQTVRALVALTSKQRPQQRRTNAIELNDAVTDVKIGSTSSENNTQPATTSNASDWSSVKHAAEYVLITAEAVARTWAASLGDESTTLAHDNLWWHKSEELHGLTSLIRLTRQSLCTENNHQMLILALLTANAVALVVQHTRFYSKAAQRYQDELRRAGHGTATADAATTTKPAAITTPAQPVIAPGTIPTPRVRDGISLGDHIVVTRPTAADKEECSICLVELNQPATVDTKNRAHLINGEDTTIRTLDCGHRFHTYCIHEHICTQSGLLGRKEHGVDEAQCPYCNQQIAGTHNVTQIGNTPTGMYENQRNGLDGIA